MMMRRITAGMWFYSLATVVTGLLDVVWGQFESSHQPIKSLSQHIPGEHALAVIIGLCLAAAGMAILWRRTARMGAVASALIYFLFALFWLPRLQVMAHAFGLGIGVIVFGLGGVGAQLLLVSPALLIYDATAAPDAGWREKAATAARWMLGLPPIAFGLGHLVSLNAYVGFVPHWIPFARFWLVLTGIAFLLAGIAIVSGIRDVLAARLLALMLLLFAAIVEIPPVLSQPHSQGAWGGAVYNFGAIGACLLFADFLVSRRKTDPRTPDLAEDYAHPLKDLVAGS